LVNQGMVSEWVVASGLHGPLAALVAMAVVIVLAQLGLTTIVTVTLLASVLPDIQALALSPLALALALMCAWTLVMVTSPFTALMQIVVDLVQRSPLLVAWRWNGLYFALGLCVLSAWVYL